MEGGFSEGSFYPKCPFLKGENTKNELKKEINGRLDHRSGDGGSDVASLVVFRTPCIS